LGVPLGLLENIFIVLEEMLWQIRNCEPKAIFQVTLCSSSSLKKELGSNLGSVTNFTPWANLASNIILMP
jgi:hypothetical protein